MFRKLLIGLLALAFILTACAPAQATSTPAPVATEIPATVAPTSAPTSEPITAVASYTDGLGREVTLTGVPQRIVSMTPATTEILFAVGAGSQVVGRDEFSDYPEGVIKLQSVGGSMGEYSYEQIAALTPDLVIAGEINTAAQVKALEDLGITVYYLANPATLEDLYVNLQTIGLMTGHAQESSELVASLMARVSAVDEKLASVTEKPIVLYEIDATDPAKPYTAGPGTFIDLLIQRAGGQNLPGLTDPYPQVSLEQVVVANPNVIVLGDSKWGTTPESVTERPGWAELDAVVNSKVYPFDDNLVSRPGPRLVDGLEELAKLLHPELFE